jgi:autotransporter-associated beta strand protein
VSEAGEAEDTLAYVENNQLAPRYAVWFPTKNALQTSNLAAQISWSTNSSTATLTFPGTNGVLTTLTAFIGLSPTNNNGVWSADADGNWSNVNNWTGGIVADGSTYTADFSQANLSADRTVTLDTSHNLGTLKFGDGSGGQNWTITNANGSTLTLNNGSSSPAIVVTNTATLASPVAGTDGFTKSGPGTLVLAGANSLSGILYLDTATSAAVNDGAVCISRSASVANVTSPIYLKNNNSGSSMLQLDGSASPVVVTQDLSLAGRNAPVIAIASLAGSNTLAGNFILTSGGGYYWFDSEAGATLNLAGRIPSSAPSVPSARTLTFLGAGDFVVTGTISNANGYAVSLVKSNSGSVALNGVNTYTGPTTVSGGTLAGVGTIAGPVTIAAGATLAPGNSAVGTLTINSALTNSGTFLMRLNKSAGGLTNDNIAGVTTLVFGGPLQLVSTGNQITAGDNFKLFSAAAYRNTITGISPAVPGTNLLWNTSNLAVNGTLSILLGAVKPQVGNFRLAGTNLVLSGGGGAAGYGFSVLGSTNLATPLTNWSLVITGVCDGSGNFVATNRLPTANPWLFYIVRVP